MKDEGKTGWSEEIELAKRLGYTVDPQRRMGDPPSFRRSRAPQPVIAIWECVHDCKVQWACAELDNGHYTNHRYHDDLETALKTEAK
jgi:hypothetical protein